MPASMSLNTARVFRWEKTPLGIMDGFFRNPEVAVGNSHGGQNLWEMTEVLRNLELIPSVSQER